jgi:hypothetical protein
VLVKQNVTSEEKALALFQRALKGDPLVDACIESYSEDRNVANFLSTLRILCHFTPEQIETFVREEFNKKDDAPPAKPAKQPAQQPVSQPVSQAANDQSDLRQIITEIDKNGLISKEGTLSLILASFSYSLTHN